MARALAGRLNRLETWWLPRDQGSDTRQNNPFVAIDMKVERMTSTRVRSGYSWTRPLQSAGDSLGLSQGLVDHGTGNLRAPRSEP